MRSWRSIPRSGSGRQLTALYSRAIDLDVEVPGTPDQVWDAIATGPGITAWMQPTEVEERKGGTFSYDMGTGTGRTYGTVTGWDPPRGSPRNPDGNSPAGPPPCLRPSGPSGPARAGRASCVWS